MKKYSNLKFHLEATGTPKVTMTFGEMSEVLGFPLPASAGKFKNWWSNTRSGQATSWQEAGYKADAKSLIFEENTENKEFNQFQITFVRRSSSSFNQPSVVPASGASNTLNNMSMVAEVILGFDELLQLGHISKKEFELIKEKALAHLL